MRVEKRERVMRLRPMRREPLEALTSRHDPGAPRLFLVPLVVLYTMLWVSEE